VSGWTKLFSSIVTSSIWCEDDPTLRVWVAMLATADAGGVVEGSIPGFANLARVTVEQMRAALVRLSSPDADSRTPDHGGRRIEAIEGGWLILNYVRYRERGQEKEGSRAPYYRAYRARKRGEAERATPSATPAVARNTEAEGKKREAGERTPALARGGWVGRVLDIWPGTVSAGHVGKVLGPVVARHGEGPMLAGLARWIDAGNARFGPEVFARDADAWVNGNGPAPSSKATVGDRQMAEAARFLKAGRG
jgi:hypothetical protein